MTAITHTTCPFTAVAGAQDLWIAGLDRSPVIDSSDTIDSLRAILSRRKENGGPWIPDDEADPILHRAENALMRGDDALAIRLAEDVTDGMDVIKKVTHIDHTFPASTGVWSDQDGAIVWRETDREWGDGWCQWMLDYFCSASTATEELPGHRDDGRTSMGTRWIAA